MLLSLPPLMPDLDKSYNFVFTSNTSKLSKKERKAKQKQALFEKYLKEVPYPHLLELDDVKSNIVVLLNKMKNFEGSVRVPSRWKHKSLFPKSYVKKEFKFTANFDFKLGLDELTNKERLFPKLGVTSVNPKDLFETFKPFTGRLTGVGEVFDFTWNFDIKQCVPGQLSQELKDALGMKGQAPPPWLFKMQTMGTPPGWPGVLYPGVNYKIPEGCVYGYEPNGWGKPIKEHPTEGLKDKINVINQYTSLKPIISAIEEPKDLKQEEEVITIEPERETINTDSIIVDKSDAIKGKGKIRDQLRKKFKF